MSLLENNSIGWCWWGYKKVDLIASAFSADVTPDYQYVIDNFRDLPIDAARARKGLMECATNLHHGAVRFRPWLVRCAPQPAVRRADLRPSSGTRSPARSTPLNYDVGDAGAAYADARSQNTEGFGGAAYNSGYNYRNDGVDIAKTSEGNGFKVAWIEANERLKFSVTVSSAGKYDLTLRTASPNSTGRLQLYLDGSPLTSVISVPRSGSWESWRSTTVKGLTLPAGAHVLEARFPAARFDLASLEFKKAR